VISKSAILGASIGLALSALLLTGSSRVSAITSNSQLPPDVAQLRDKGVKLAAQGRYYDARAALLSASSRAMALGLSRPAAMNLVSAGGCLYLALNFRDAENDFERARDLARSTGEMAALAAAENNLANLYLHIGERTKALEVARQALAGREGNADASIHGKLLFQEALALAETNRFPEAEPFYRSAIEELTDQNDLDAAARIEGAYGAELLKADRLDEAEDTLGRGLELVRIHRLNASANILTSLAELKSRRGDVLSAVNLFRAALEAPANLSPTWGIRAREGRFFLARGDVVRALDDFREARRVALEMRADIVPADQDRIQLESNDELTWVIEGLVEAGNRQARKTGDHKVLQETFDAAEQDRMWSLRALVPSPNDWRTRLPNHYWELLAQYQTLERTAVTARSPEAEQRIEKLKAELQGIEKGAAGAHTEVSSSQSALEHARSVLDDDAVLFSFLITKTSAWIWAVDRGHVDVYPLPSPSRIEAEAKAFNDAARRGDLTSPAAADLYRDLFGSVPNAYLKHRRWLIEPDGPLLGLPLAALRPEPGEFLVERAALESIPGALLLERGAVSSNASFVGIGDPIYNGADARYRGSSGKPDLTLPRLPNTTGELDACSRAWGSSHSTILTGSAATAQGVETALSSGADIVHFATHVITAPGEFRSGLIALSLDGTGGMGLLGPREIVARPVTSSLVVMNGCHSGQGDPLPSTGLMGLTRAWIGAGAKAVISTGWDVPDTTAQSLMTDLYSALRASPEQGVSAALRQAQLYALRRDADQSAKTTGSQWAAYSLLSRIP